VQTFPRKPDTARARGCNPVSAWMDAALSPTSVAYVDKTSEQERGRAMAWLSGTASLGAVLGRRRHMRLCVARLRVCASGSEPMNCK